MSFKQEDLEKLMKFKIIKGVLIISIIYRSTKEFLYNFFHPMTRIEKDALAEAEEINKKLELFYGDMKSYKIKGNAEALFYEGDKTRLMAIFKANIINEASSKLIQSVLEKFLYEFEAKYVKDLKVYKGDSSIFKDAGQMLYQYLNVDLTFPHTSKYQGFDPDDPLEKYIFKAADIFTRKIGYFYLDNLVYLTKEYVREKAREDGTEDPDKVEFPPDEKFYLAMFNLKKIGMLQKIDNFLEELKLYSKIQY